MGTKGTRGILNPLDGFAHFTLEREPAPEDLSEVVEGFWVVRWKLEEGERFEQEILPYPCVNLSFGGALERAASFEVHGPGTRRFAAKLAGEGRVVGTKFKPAGFHAFASVPMRTLVDAVTTIEEAIGRASPPIDGDDPSIVRDAVLGLLRDAIVRDDAITVVNRLVARASEDRSIARAEDLARIAGMSVRSLHRLFERYVGVGPKWIVRRSRVQEAAERVARGEDVDWARTAQELGYHDQAHLIRDFGAQVGFTPAAYARRCKAAQEAAASASSQLVEGRNEVSLG